MSEQGESRPRRALPSHDGGPASGSADQGAGPGRRAASEASPTRPEPTPAGSGRRFAGASDPLSSSAEGHGTRALAAPAAALGKRRLIVGVVSAVVLALIFGAVVVAQQAGLFNGRATPEPSASATPSVDPVATYLAQPADLSNLTPGSWTTVSTATSLDTTTPQAKCLLPSTEQKHAPVDAMVRTFAAGGDAGAVLHQVSRYDTPSTAAAAYQELITQLGNCDRAPLFAAHGLTITGLSDEATGQVMMLQDATAAYHTILISRTGARVNIMDATQPKQPVKGETLGGVLAAVSTRQCGDGGTCPATVAVADGAPLPATPRGWLTAVDLPRLTPGSGAWHGTDVADTVSSTGTRCEALDLTAMPGATKKQQRTFVLRDDTNAPASFGVDEVVYTFASADEARATLTKLGQNMDSCPTRASTATVTKTGDPLGSGNSGTWAVTQKVDQASATASFRSGAAVAGTRLVYLLANPTEQFNFTEETWNGVVARAGQRVAQLG